MGRTYKGRILLTGKNGQVGWDLQRALAPLGEVVALGRQELDLADPGAVRRSVREVRPGLIVNGGAYTAVDRAEAEPALAMAVNGIAPGILAEEAREVGAALIHYSTDYVFDGTKPGAYSEEDEPSPLNVYGKTKLAGERAIQAVGVPHLIFRTSWIYGLRGNNFLMTVLRLAMERDELRVVNDQRGSPTWSRSVAEATAKILARTSFSLDRKGGLYHLSAGGETTWFGFASAILARVGRDRGRLARLTPIPSHDYPTPARRPTNSLLSNTKLQQAFGITLPYWEEPLDLLLGKPNHLIGHAVLGHPG
ncbi:MAG: dTDP-4-dehydrorhamnose reductase [Bacillota bacterium]